MSQFLGGFKKNGKEKTTDKEKARKWLKEGAEVEAWLHDGISSRFIWIDEIFKTEVDNIFVLKEQKTGELFLVTTPVFSEQQIYVDLFAHDVGGLYDEDSALVEELVNQGATIYAIGTNLNGEVVVTPRIKKFINNEKFETYSGTQYVILKRDC